MAIALAGFMSYESRNMASGLRTG